jgi:hypothetical protein
MRAALLLLALPSVAAAQVIECPKFYPWQDTRISEVPYQHKGVGFIAKAKLSGAGMYEGELNGRGELQGDRRKVKGGWEVLHGFELGRQKWLVCSYGAGDITWWEELGPKITSCTLQTREAGRDPAEAKATCK